MKHNLIVILVFISFSFHCQNWNPISLATKSVFVEDSYPSPLVCFAFDSVEIIGIDSIFHNYKKFGFNPDAGNNPNCPGWGASCVIDANQTPEFGEKVFRQGDDYYFYNIGGDSLFFNFKWDSIPIYSNSDTLFYALFEKDTLLSFSGIMDSVKIFNLRMTHIDQTPILNSLHGYDLRLSKNYGILDFFQVRGFPDTLEYYSFFGGITTHDSIGHWCIKEYEFYNASVNDQYQFKKTYSYQSNVDYIYRRVISSGFAQGNYEVNYKKEDSTLISLTIDTNMIASTIPFKYGDLPDFGFDVLNFSLMVDSGCSGLGYYGGYETKNDLYYCSNSDCYSPIDQDCHESYYFEIAPVIGIYQTKYDQFSGSWNCGGFWNNEVTYSFIDGTECGSLEHLSNDEILVNTVELYPNPTSRTVYIDSNTEVFKSYIIYDLLGNVMEIGIITNGSIDFSNYITGTYFVELRASNKSEMKKVIKL